MSSKSEVLIRIRVLLQRKTLIETKNRTLKSLNGVIRRCDQWKMLQCWQRTGHLPSFFVPTPAELTALSPHPREFTIQGQKNANARGSAEGRKGGRGARRSWNWLMNNVAKCRLFSISQTVSYTTSQKHTGWANLVQKTLDPLVLVFLISNQLVSIDGGNKMCFLF